MNFYKRVQHKDKILTAFILIISLSGTIVVWQSLKKSALNDVQTYFDFRVRESNLAIERRMVDYEQALRGVRGLFIASGNVTREEFNVYVNALQVEEKFPGIQGIGFSKIILPSEKDNHISGIRGQGFPDYWIRPEGIRELYTSIIFLEPFSGRNLRAFGYDMYSEPIRRQAMELARDSAIVSISGKVELVQETEKDKQAGFLMYLPFYKNGRIPPSVEGRRADIAGWVYSPFRMNDLMDGLFGERSADMVIKIYDGDSINPNSMLYNSNANNADIVHDFQIIKKLNISGHTWSVVTKSTSGLTARLGNNKPMFFLFGGIGISFLLTFIIWLIIRDIAERKKSGEVLRASEEKYRLLAENSSDVIWVLNLNQRRFIYMSPSIYRLRGLTVEEAVNESVNDALTPESLELVTSMLNRDVPEFIKNPDNPFYSINEVRQPHKNGSLVWVEISSLYRMNESGEIELVGVSRNIDERKQAEQALKESEEKFKSLMQQSPFVVELYNLKGLQISVNKAYEELWNFPAETTLNKFNVLESKEVEDTGLMEYVKRAYAGESVVVPEFIFNPTGNTEAKGVGRVRWLSTRIYPLKELSDKVVNIVIVHQDITDRKQAENEIIKLNVELEKRVANRTSQLEIANKELEAFSYSVSHDLRAPLRHINGFIDMLTNQFPDSLPEKGMDYLNIIKDSGRQMGLLIDDLLQFSRTGRQELRKSSIDMNLVFEEVLTTTIRDAEDRKIEWITNSLPTVYCDQSLIKQVWVNLLSNAVKFTRKNEKTAIEIGYEENEKDFVFSVRDNGVGFDMKYANKLFGVFQRLHSRADYDGTGIGLANVQRIIHRHGGRVWAEAEQDKGAIFYFSLPK